MGFPGLCWLSSFMSGAASKSGGYTTVLHHGFLLSLAAG